MGLLDEGYRRPRPQESPIDPPVIHSVQLLKGSYGRADEQASSWMSISVRLIILHFTNGLWDCLSRVGLASLFQPVSSSIVTETQFDRLHSSAKTSPAAAHLNPGFFSSLANLWRLSGRRSHRERHRKPDASASSTGKDPYQSEQGPRRCVTSVLIAMPSVKQRDRWRESSSYEEEDILPEIMLGISDQEVAWAGEDQDCS